MSVSRRTLLHAGVLAGGVGLIQGCTSIGSRYAGGDLPEQIPQPDHKTQPDFRFLNRAAFGATPQLTADLKAQGHKAFLEKQLAPNDDESIGLRIALAGIPVLRIDGLEMHDEPEQFITDSLEQAEILRVVYSQWQIRERMVDFWTNHFNISGRKRLVGWRKGRDEQKVIRANALGRFEDLVMASATSPAMLDYLDNPLNGKNGPNENYARELMELHTLGVNGGYTQRDVQEVARCFTGWTIEDRYLRPRGKFRFDPDRHDDGAKTVLGTKIPARMGEGDGRQVVRLLANHPSAARFITGKLCRYFAGDALSPVQPRAEKAFLDSKGDIKEVLRTILLSEELLDGPPIMKRPLDYVASSLRALGGKTDGRALQRHLQLMGQPLYEWPMPDGYPDRTAAWTGSLLARWNFAVALASGSIGGTSIQAEEAVRKVGASPERAVSALLLGSDYLAPKLGGGSLAETTALALSAPEFQWR